MVAMTAIDCSLTPSRFVGDRKPRGELKTLSWDSTSFDGDCWHLELPFGDLSGKSIAFC